MSKRWDFIIYDIAKISPEGNTSFFIDTEESNYKKVTEYTESEILDFLLSDDSIKSFIFELLGFSNPNETNYLKEVSYPIILDSNKKPGDVDLIFYSNNEIDKSMALEVKCVKAQTLDDGEVRINKENNITKGITQVNNYNKLGFNKNYLLIILLDNGEKITNSNQFYRDSDLTKSKKLFNDNVLSNLDDNIGLVYLQVNQVTGKSIKLSCKINIRVEKKSKEVIQNKNITDFLCSKFK